MPEITLDDLNETDRATFVQRLGGIFEHSPWVAERAFNKRPFASVGALHRAMVEAVENADLELKLALLHAHPDLAGKAALAGELTDHSRREQAGAGLDRLTPEEYARFHALNTRYREKFGFPFILAVKGHTKHSILKSFEARLPHSREDEMATALEQVYRIAEFRLHELVGEPS
jgi:2-oxo-4-hydroxy-4-carboxy-5-ureidoimidazoline decarboxylase